MLQSCSTLGVKMESLSMLVLGVVILIGLGGLLILLGARLFFDSKGPKDKQPEPTESHLKETDIYSLAGDQEQSIPDQSKKEKEKEKKVA